MLRPDSVNQPGDDHEQQRRTLEKCHFASGEVLEGLPEKETEQAMIKAGIRVTQVGTT